MFCCNVLHTHCLKKSFASLKLLAASCTGAQPKPALMTASVNGFMYKTYYSISETMPTRRGVKLNSCQVMVLLFFILRPKSSHNMHARLVTASISLGDDVARTKLLQELLNDALEGPTTRMLKLDPSKMAYRELPPGNWSQLYCLYQAHCLALKQPAASKSVFYECTLQWRRCLKFRHRSQHSVCATCDRLRAEMRHSGSFMEHARAADNLLGHLTLTWKCREQYWHARAVSQAKQDLLCIIVDGYDRSKPMIPRWTQGRAPKGGAFEAWTYT